MKQETYLSKAEGVECPECNQQTAYLYKNPHDYAGQYECSRKECGANWECEHPQTTPEDYEHPQKSHEENFRTSKIIVCDDCEKDVTDEVGC